MSEPSTGAGLAASAVPLFPLNTVLFPGGPLSLRIFETRYVDMIRKCMRERSTFGVVLLQGGGSEVRSAGIISTTDVGTSARIVDFNSLPDGLLGITSIGEQTFNVVKRWQQADGLNLADLEYRAAEERIELPEEFQHLGELLRKVLPELGDLYVNVSTNFSDSTWVGNRLAEILPMSLADKQQCLELDNPLTRLASLNRLIRRGR
jgi:Lon protease-like protein